MKSVAFFILCRGRYGAADIPRTLVSEDEAEPIHSAISRKEAWTVESVRRIRAEAEKRMKEGPWTVTAERPVGIIRSPIPRLFQRSAVLVAEPGQSLRSFRAERRPGKPEPVFSQQGGPHRDGDAVFTLGAAAFFLDEPRYGERAARMIHAWFLNPKTRMNPHLQYGQVIRGVTSGGSGILDGRSFLRAIQGMEFLAQTRTWNLQEQAGVRKWFEEYLRWLTTSDDALDEKHSGNNHASWWAAQTAAVASFVDNSAAQQMVFKYYEITFSLARSGRTAPRPEKKAARARSRSRRSTWRHSR